MLFHCADGDRFEPLFDDAAAFAQTVLRADPATNFGHVVCLRRQSIGLFHPALGRQHQPVRDVVVQRAVDLAEGHATLRTARCLRFRRALVELVIDFGKVTDTRMGLALCGHFLVCSHKGQHLVRHHFPLFAPTMFTHVNRGKKRRGTYAAIAVNPTPIKDMQAPRRK